MASRGSSCFVSSWTISHLGPNPVRGGRPPRDNRRRVAIPVRVGAFAQEFPRVQMLRDCVRINVRNAEEVMIR